MAVNESDEIVLVVLYGSLIRAVGRTGFAPWRFSHRLSTAVPVAVIEGQAAALVGFEQSGSL